MIEEICSNAASSADIHQAYRQALTQERVLDAAGTKRQLEREDALFEREIQERKLALEERKSHMGVEVDERKLALQEKKL
jgi:GAF domain-containing protein